MVGSILIVLVILICHNMIFAYHTRHFTQQPTYWQLRRQLIKDEMQQSLGGGLQLNPMEVRANRVLMAAKRREVHDGSILSLLIIILVIVFAINLRARISLHTITFT